MAEGDGSTFLLCNCLEEGFDPGLPMCPCSLGKAERQSPQEG